LQNGKADEWRRQCVREWGRRRSDEPPDRCPDECKRRVEREREADAGEPSLENFGAYSCAGAYRRAFLALGFVPVIVGGRLSDFYRRTTTMSWLRQ
jgi:hypothetical protein